MVIVRPPWYDGVIGPLPEAFERKGDRTLVLLPLCIGDLETGGLANVLGRAEEHRGTLMSTALGCHPGEGLEQKLESGPVVDACLVAAPARAWTSASCLSPRRQWTCEVAPSM